MDEGINETTEQPAAEVLGQFVLILQDAGGEIHVAGVQKPEAFDPSLASHLVGRWLSENLEMVCKLAQAAQLEREQRERGEAAMQALADENQRLGLSYGDPAAPAIITDERERTIVSAGPAVIYTGHAA